MREAKVAAAITHPNVISIIDVGQHNGQPYMVLELVSGGDASQLATRVGGSLPEARALELIHDSALGLEALYAARLLHRDIKPSNIFIDANGRGKLADLGLARSESGDEKLTTTGITVGTPAYMSPEQARADDNLDIRSDIYSLGATLYALVTGQAPYTGNSPMAIAAKVLTEPPPNPLTFQPKLSPETVHIIKRTLAKDPAQRFQTPTELLEALTEAQEQLLNPGNRTAATNLLPRKRIAQGVAPRSRLPVPGNKMKTYLPLMAVLVVGASAMMWALSGRRAPAAPSKELGEPPQVVPPLSTVSLAKEMPEKTATVAKPTVAIIPLEQTKASLPSVTPTAISNKMNQAPLTNAPLAPWASAQGTDEYGSWAELVIQGVVQRLRWLPPSTQTIGSRTDEPHYIDVEKQSQVTFARGFWIADTECTQILWRTVMGHNPAHDQSNPRNPVEQVSMDDIRLFTAALRKREPKLQARMPSRAEWEYACRGGTTTWYWSGNDLAGLMKIANVAPVEELNKDNQEPHVQGNDGFSGVAPVASFPPNPFGLYDCHGNVSEYCLGFYRPIPQHATDPETNEADQSVGFIRGGNFDCRAATSRSGALPNLMPKTRAADVGFRFIIEASR